MTHHNVRWCREPLNQQPHLVIDVQIERPPDLAHTFRSQPILGGNQQRRNYRRIRSLQHTKIAHFVVVLLQVHLINLSGDAPLLVAAQDWLRAEGMREVRGPFNLHVNDEVGLLVEGFSTPPYVMMGHALPWYGSAVEASGFIGAKDLLAYHVRPDFEAPRVMERLAKRVSGRVRVRSVRRKQLSEDAAIMLDIFNDAWQDNWGFVPLAAQEWAETVSMLTKLMPDDYIQIAEYDGEPVAFIVALPNLNEAARDLNGRLLPFGWAKLLWRLKVRHPKTARVPLMGVRKSFQHSRLGPTLAFMVIDAVRKALHARGVQDVEMGWILEDNDGMCNIIETIGGEAYKRYRVYQKEL